MKPPSSTLSSVLPPLTCGVCLIQDCSSIIRKADERPWGRREGFLRDGAVDGEHLQQVAP